LKVNPNYKVINVENQEEDPDSILNFYRELLKTRKEHDVFVFGDVVELDFENTNVYAYKKVLKDEQIIVLVNFGNLKIDFEVPESILNSSVLINNYSDVEILENRVKMRPYQGLILKN